MRLQSLREEVLEANLELVRRGLVIDTFGNASGISREEGLVVIKPSGVAYDRMRPEDLVVTDIDGNIVEGTLRPSSDLPTHLALYRAFAIGGVAHTHSRSATAWAQAGRPIPCLGTTHADYFHGPVPVTACLQPAEIKTNYELNTGHAPFCSGRSPAQAAHIAWILEEVAQMAYASIVINSGVAPLADELRDKHFLRKHGPEAYYGQKKRS